MKTILFIPLMLLFIIPCFAQQAGYVYTGRSNPSVNKEKLTAAVFIDDVAPDLWKHIILPAKGRFELDQRTKTQGYYAYQTLIDYVSVTISTDSKGSKQSAQSKDAKLTAEQKSLLSTVQHGADITIDITFNYKIASSDSNAIKGFLRVTAVPEQEAVFPGGNKQLTAYIQEHIFNRLTQPGVLEKIQRSVLRLTVNEDGHLSDIKLTGRGLDKETTQLVLDAIRNMPRWLPASNAKGVKVKQLFRIPFGMDGC
ncbi:MAG: energy transducer TonB [Bacteroidota bacterium]